MCVKVKSIFIAENLRYSNFSLIYFHECHYFFWELGKKFN